MAKTKVSRIEKYSTSKNIDFSRPSYIEIDLDAFNANFRKIRHMAGPKTAIMAVVKANAYGHGLVKIGLQAEKLGADYLGVAFIEEAQKLLEAGIKTPIVVLYPDTPERAVPLVKAGLIATVGSADYLEALNQAALEFNAAVKVFIKAETGMGRYGVDNIGLSTLIGLGKHMKGIEIIGVSTNLADSSNGDDTFTREQFARFDRMLSSSGLDSSYITSIENSSGLSLHHDDRFNLVRVGILLYGYPPKNMPGIEFEPVMSLKSRIIQLKNWPVGKPVGYGGKYTSSRDMVIATLGIGYADGYFWSLSNKSHVLVNGCKAPVVGRICMDALMIDVTDVPDIKVGDEAVLLGKSGDKEITAEELSGLAGSFVYEFLSGMSDRLPRIYKGE
jgi:alanine racemase